MSDDTNTPAEDAAAVGETAPAAVESAISDAAVDAGAADGAAAAPAPAAPAKGKRNVRRQVTTSMVDAATTSTVKKTEVVDADEAELPARVTLAAPYAFYDDENVLHSWLAGSVVEDAGEISLLVERGAVFEAE